MAKTTKTMAYVTRSVASQIGRMGYNKGIQGSGSAKLSRSNSKGDILIGSKDEVMFFRVFSGTPAQPGRVNPPYVVYGRLCYRQYNRNGVEYAGGTPGVIYSPKALRPGDEVWCVFNSGHWEPLNIAPYIPSYSPSPSPSHSPPNYNFTTNSLNFCRAEASPSFDPYLLPCCIPTVYFEITQTKVSDPLYHEVITGSATLDRINEYANTACLAGKGCVVTSTSLPDWSIVTRSDIATTNFVRIQHAVRLGSDWYSSDWDYRFIFTSFTPDEWVVGPVQTYPDYAYGPSTDIRVQCRMYYTCTAAPSISPSPSPSLCPCDITVVTTPKTFVSGGFNYYLAYVDINPTTLCQTFRYSNAGEFGPTAYYWEQCPGVPGRWVYDDPGISVSPVCTVSNWVVYDTIGGIAWPYTFSHVDYDRYTGEIVCVYYSNPSATPTMIQRCGTTWVTGSGDPPYCICGSVSPSPSIPPCIPERDTISTGTIEWGDASLYINIVQYHPTGEVRYYMNMVGGGSGPWYSTVDGWHDTGGITPEGIPVGNPTPLIICVGGIEYYIVSAQTTGVTGGLASATYRKTYIDIATQITWTPESGWSAIPDNCGMCHSPSPSYNDCPATGTDGEQVCYNGQTYTSWGDQTGYEVKEYCTEQFGATCIWNTFGEWNVHPVVCGPCPEGCVPNHGDLYFEPVMVGSDECYLNSITIVDEEISYNYYNPNTAESFAYYEGEWSIEDVVGVAPSGMVSPLSVCKDGTSTGITEVFISGPMTFVYSYGGLYYTDGLGWLDGIEPDSCGDCP